MANLSSVERLDLRRRRLLLCARGERMSERRDQQPSVFLSHRSLAMRETCCAFGRVLRLSADSRAEQIRSRSSSSAVDRRTASPPSESGAVSSEHCISLAFLFVLCLRLLSLFLFFCFVPVTVWHGGKGHRRQRHTQKRKCSRNREKRGEAEGRRVRFVVSDTCLPCSLAAASLTCAGRSMPD